MLFVFDLGKICSIDILYNHCIRLLSKLGRLEKQNFCVKFEYVFSDPECPFVFCVWEMLNGIGIMLKGTLEDRGL